MEQSVKVLPGHATFLSWNVKVSLKQVS